MKRREILALIIFFAMTTAALTPTAYRLGVTHGTAFAAMAPPARANLFENGAQPTSGPITTRRLTAQDCPTLGQPGGIARPGIEIDCLPAPGAHTAPAFAAAPKLSARAGSGAGNLTTAMVSAIAGGNTGATGTQTNAIGSPIGLALAPDGKPGKAGFIPGGGFPGSLIPVGLTAQAPPPGNTAPPGDNPPPPVAPPADPIGPIGDPPEGPFDDPFEDLPEMVVPLPAGLPLMLTGLIGLFAASRKK
ncbi:MAG: VPLPA-CTERM sorting domain-containing protein [Alphaproteobacteria bacterium]|nr:VPLPA-CTERM sorting domain-containing protein [Alphaproteobacteria bacterium]